MFAPKQHHRYSVRLPHHDYREAGAYFVTICTAQKRPVFGRLENGNVRLHPYGKIVEEEWLRTAELRPEIVLDEYIIMPDHFHAIIILRRGMARHAQNSAKNRTSDGLEESNAHGGMARHAPTREFAKPQKQSIASIIGAFKGSVTPSINAHRAQHNLSPVIVWQRSFYERVIRNETELNETRRYIIENPLPQPVGLQHPMSRQVAVGLIYR